MENNIMQAYSYAGITKRLITTELVKSRQRYRLYRDASAMYLLQYIW